MPSINLASAIWLMLTLTITPDIAGQCPDGSDISSNGHCFMTFWVVPPNPLPAAIVHSGDVFTYISGAGTESDPATYQSGGGGGSCNANQDPFSGTIIVDGMECTYEDGMLQEPLPIQLFQFTASEIDQKVRLDWSTAVEAQNKGFELQKSIDAKTWINLTWIKGNQNSSTVNKYSAVDDNPKTGNNYYRLCQIDEDGTVNYSPIVSIRVANKFGTVSIYPNPANNTLHIEAAEASSFSIITMSGDILHARQDGSNHEIDISTLPQGVYMVINSTTGEALKFLKI